MSKLKQMKKLWTSLSGIFSIIVLLLALAPISAPKADAAKSIYVPKTEAYRGETVRFYSGGMATGTTDGVLGLAFTNKVTLANGTVIMNDKNFPSGIVFYDPAPLNPGDPWTPFTVVGVLDEDGKAIPNYGADALAIGGGNFSDAGCQYYFPYARPILDEFSLYIDVEVPTDLPASYTNAKFELFFDLYNVQAYSLVHATQYKVRLPQIDYASMSEAASYPLAAVPTDFTLVYPAQKILPTGTISPMWWWDVDDAVGHFFVRTKDAGDTGTLSITKTVDGDPAPNQSFNFTVTKNNMNVVGTYTVTGPNAPTGAKTITNGVVTLAAGQTATINDLEIGTDYKIVESDPGGRYTTSYTITGGATKSGDGLDTGTFAVAKDTTTAVTFVNLYSIEPTDLALKGTKTLLGIKNENFSNSIQPGEFVFTLTSSPSNPKDGCTWGGNNPIGVAAGGDIDFGRLTFKKEGTYEFTARETVPNPVPAGWKYDTEAVTITVVVEDVGGQLTISSTSYSKDGIDDDGIHFSNQCGELLGTDSTLIITKVDGNRKPLSGIEFYLMVSLDNGNTWNDYGTTHAVPYRATNELGVVVFRELPTGMYKIVEITENPAYGKPIYSPSDTFTILEEETLVVEVTVVNPFPTPTTGDNSPLKQWVNVSALAMVALICCGLPLVRKRRKNEEL